MIILNGGSYYPDSIKLDRYFIDMLSANDFIGFIPNVTERSKKEWTDYFRKVMGNYCTNKVIEIDLEAEWKIQIEKVKVVYIAGGNTYKLMKIMNQSGFKEYITENHERFCLVGNSAGAVVLGQNIQTSNDANTYSEKDYAGLGLVPFSICPHYTEDKYNRLKNIKEENDLRILGIPEKCGIVMTSQRIDIGKIVKI